MTVVSISLGTAARLWVTSDAFGVTVACPPYWQQRLTRDETRRLAEALVDAAEHDS